MPWVWHGKSGDEVGEAIREIGKGSDRAAAIVAVAFLESQLRVILELHFRKDTAVTGRFFRYPGPLSTFAAKIDMAYLIDLFDKETRRELHTIRDIRNEFAHQLGKRDFEQHRIRDLTGNLQLTYDRPISMRGSDGILIPVLSFRPGKEADAPVTGRERFVDSCKWHIATLALLAADGPKSSA
jgi:hypothetical protein